MTHRTPRSTRGARRRAWCVAALVVGGAAVTVPAGTTHAAPLPSAVVTAADAPPAVEEVLDGWFRVELPPGWTVIGRAAEFQRFRQDFAADPVTEPRPQLLLDITNEISDVFVLREANFLRVDDELAWRDAMAAQVLGDGAQLLGTDTVPGVHGPINRAFFQGTRTHMVASSRVGDQLIAVVADMPLDPDQAEIEALNSLLVSLVFDEQFAVPQLLNFHGAWAWLDDVQGQRRIEIDYDLPSNWQEVPGEHIARTIGPTAVEALMQSSADGSAWFQIIYREDDGSTVETRIDDVIDAVLTVRPDDAPFLDATGNMTIDGVVFRVALIGGVRLDPLVPEGQTADDEALPDGVTGMAAVLIADVGDVDVEIVMVNAIGDADVARLFAAIIDSLAVRAWNADGTALES